jgi:hypothetical protein
MPVELTKRRFTADDYQRMGQAGILSEVCRGGGSSDHSFSTRTGGRRPSLAARRA